MTYDFKNLFSYHQVKRKDHVLYLWCMRASVVKYCPAKHEDGSGDKGVELGICVVGNPGL